MYNRDAWKIKSKCYIINLENVIFPKYSFDNWTLFTLLWRPIFFFTRVLVTTDLISLYILYIFVLCITNYCIKVLDYIFSWALHPILGIKYWKSVQDVYLFFKVFELSNTQKIFKQYVPSLVEIDSVLILKSWKIWNIYIQKKRQPDNWSEKLIRAFSSGELKPKRKILHIFTYLYAAWISKASYSKLCNICNQRITILKIYV